MDLTFALRLIARAWLLPPAVFLLLALVGLLLAGRRPRLGRGLALVGLAGVLAMSMPVVADGLQRRVEAYPPLDLARPVDAQAVVVLAGAVRAGPVPGAPHEPTPVTLERLAHGVEVARRAGLPLLLSGGSVHGEPPAALAMQRALDRYFGLQARWLEARSRTTAENARYSAALLAPAGVRRVVLVTSANHMRRSVAQFRAHGLDVVPAPIGATRAGSHGLGRWLPSVGSLQRSADAVYELAGLVLTAPRAPSPAVR